MSDPNIYRPVQPHEPGPVEVFNVARLTPFLKEMALRYRSQRLSAEEEEANARWALFVIAALALVIVLLVQLGGPIWVTPSGIVFGTTFSVPIAFWLVITRRTSIRVAFLVLVSGVALPILFYLVYEATRHLAARLALQLLGIGLALLFLDRFRLHYLMWMLANPYVRRAIYEERKEWYKSRFNGARITQLISEQDSAALAPEHIALRKEELSALAAWGGPIYLLCWYVALPLVPQRFLGATLTVLIPPVLVWYIFTDERYSPREMLRTLWAAWTRWTNDERMPPLPAPGVFHSPVGIWRWRMVLAFLPVLFIAATVLPSVHFFPIAWELSFGHGWPKAVGEALRMPGSPAWLVSTAMGLGQSVSYLLALGLSLLASLVVPVLAIAGTLYTSGSVLVRAYAALEADGALEQDREEL